MKLVLSLILVLFVALSCAQSNDGDEESFSCTLSKKFQKDCHECTCSATGTYAVCTGFTCDPDNKSNLMKAPENCKDDDKWSDGCNACRCINGYFACSRSSCSMLLGKKPVDEVQAESEQIDVPELIV